MSNRTQTVINRDHPHNIIHSVGQNAKSSVRKLSNAKLDLMLTKNIKDDELKKEVLAMNRSDKIKFVKNSVMSSLATQLKEEQEEKEKKDDLK